MIEIIPNWHPIFVHFTVALFSTSVGFYGLAYIVSFFKKTSWTFTHEFEVVARWCLWSGAIITIITVSAGLYAYYTVMHDDVAHQAMLKHRNWALPTAGAILLAAGWSVWKYIHQQRITLIFFLILLSLEGALLSTAWHGGEVVYRYGVGVMSLPKSEGIGHNHDHEATEDHLSNMPRSHEHNPPN